MGDHRRLVLLIAIMTGVAFIVGAVALGVFYAAALDRERQRLSNFATGQARLIEVLTPTKLPVLLEQQRRHREESAGRTAELQLARRQGNEILFLTPARGSHQPPDPVRFGTPLAEPMARALSGSRGTMIGRDYAGRRVLAAYEPVAGLDLGLVVKIDMAEINRHYLQAAMIAGLVSLAAVIGAALLFQRLGEPMIGRIHDSEAQYRQLVEAQPDPICRFLPDTTLTFVNRAYAAFYGHEPDALIGKRWLDFAAKDDRPRFLDELASFTPENPDRHEETRSTRADGEVRWHLCHIHGFFDDAGRIQFFQTFGTDVSKRKEAERALEESESRMRALLNASQDEILLMATDGTVLAINKAAERRLSRRTGGSTPVGAPLDRLLPAAEADERMSQVRHVARTSTLAHWEVPIRARWFEFWFYPVPPPAGPVTEVAVYAREITEQKQSQAELGKLFQAVQQSPMSVIITDRNGNIEYVNPEFSEVTGYAPTEAIGQNPRILKSGHTPADVYEDLWQTISTGGVWRGELLNKKKNGELYWELASIAPVKKGEAITNYVAVKEDITERREMEEQLRQSQKMQAVGQLTGGIAHDFNNLLAIVIGNLALVRERVSGDAKAEEYLDDALWSARQGGELTRRLLAFARKQPLKPAIVDLNDVVRGMTELLRRTLGSTIRIEELLEPGLWRAFADRGELERAVVNLAVNAQHAMQEAGTLTLETRNVLLDEDYAEQFEEVTAGEYVLLAVTDTGAGMPPEIVERVFEPFFTTKEAGQGSGLGLSMVYGFVKQSGGHISINSRVNQGTSVKLYLPRAPSPGPAA